MKRVFICFLVGALSVEAVDFNYQLTGANESVLILESVTLNSPIPEGSIIGAFYTNNLGTLICAGTASWSTSSSVGFPIWGSGGVFDEGFSEGEEITWFVEYPSGNQFELIMSYGDNNGNNQYYTNSFRWINNITVIDETNCDLQPDLCIVSVIDCCLDASYSEYNPLATISNGSCNLSWEYLYTSILQNVLELQAENLSLELVTNQATYLYQTQILENIELQNTISDLESIVNESVQISINMNEGWNMVGFTQSTPMDVAGSVAAISESVSLIKDNEGNAFWSEYNFNGIGEFVPGMGYQVKLVESVSNFSFPNISGQ